MKENQTKSKKKDTSLEDCRDADCFVVDWMTSSLPRDRDAFKLKDTRTSLVLPDMPGPALFKDKGDKGAHDGMTGRAISTGLSVRREGRWEKTREQNKREKRKTK